MTFNDFIILLQKIFEVSTHIVKILIVIIGGLALILFIIITVLYLPSLFQKKINLKEAENIMEHNLEIVEEATFFKTNNKFNEHIEKQKEEIRGNAAKIKAQTAEMSQRDTDLANLPPKNSAK